MTAANDLGSSTITVVGAGNMGSGIAQKYAMHGHSVNVIDRDETTLKKSQDFIFKSLDQGAERGIFTAEEASATKARLNFSTQISVVTQSDLVIEAIFENLSLKQELFKELDRLAPKDTVLATNTSSLKVVDVQDGLQHPDRVVGLHYFFPPSRNRLVEIIGTTKTSQSALDRAADLQTSIKKTIIHSKDSPGFIVNRFFVPWLNEAMRIVHEGYANIATVEKAACTFFQIGMGPFALMNATGLPITLHSCEALARTLGDFYAPSPLIIPQCEKRAPWDLSGDVNEALCTNIAARLLTVIALLSTQMVCNENVCTTADVDVGAKVGLMWKKGPFEMINEHHALISSTIELMQREKKALPNADAFFHYASTIARD